MAANKKEEQLKKQDEFWFSIIEKYEHAVEDLQRELRRRKATVNQLEQALQPQVYYKMFQLGKDVETLNIDELLSGKPIKRDRFNAVKELIRDVCEICKEINKVIEESLMDALASSRGGLCKNTDRNVCECLGAQSKVKEQLRDILNDLDRQNELYKGVASLLLNNCEYILGCEADVDVLNTVHDVVKEGRALGLRIDQMILDKYEKALQVVSSKDVRDNCGALILKLIERKHGIEMMVAEVVFNRRPKEECKVDCFEFMMKLIGDVREFSDEVDQVVIAKVMKIEGRRKPACCGDVEAFGRISDVVQMKHEVVDSVLEIISDSYGSALDWFEEPAGVKLLCELQFRDLLRQQRSLTEDIDGLILDRYRMLFDGSTGEGNKCTATIVELVEMKGKVEGLLHQFIGRFYESASEKQPSQQLDVQPVKLPQQCDCGPLKLLDLVDEQRKLARATDCVLIKVCLKLCDCKGDGKLLKDLYMEQRAIADDVDELMKECFSRYLRGLECNYCPGLLKQLAKQEKKLARKIDELVLEKCKDPKIHELVKCERDLSKEVDQLLFLKCGARLGKKPSALIKSLSGISVFDMKNNDVDALQEISDLVKKEHKASKDVDRLRQKERIIAELKQKMLNLVKGGDLNDDKVEVTADTLEGTNQRLLKLNAFLGQERRDVHSEYDIFITEMCQPVINQIHLCRDKNRQLSRRIGELGRAMKKARAKDLQGLPEQLKDTNDRLRQEMELNELLKQQIAQLREKKDDLEWQVKRGMRENINDKLAMIF